MPSSCFLTSACNAQECETRQEDPKDRALEAHDDALEVLLLGDVALDTAEIICRLVSGISRESLPSLQTLRRTMQWVYRAGWKKKGS